MGCRDEVWYGGLVGIVGEWESGGIEEGFAACKEKARYEKRGAKAVDGLVLVPYSFFLSLAIAPRRFGPNTHPTTTQPHLASSSTAPRLSAHGRVAPTTLPRRAAWCMGAPSCRLLQAVWAFFIHKETGEETVVDVKPGDLVSWDNVAYEQTATGAARAMLGPMAFKGGALVEVCVPSETLSGYWPTNLNLQAGALLVNPGSVVPRAQEHPERNGDRLHGGDGRAHRHRPSRGDCEVRGKGAGRRAAANGGSVQALCLPACLPTRLTGWDRYGGV